MCVITSSLKKRFCTDNNLSIQLYSEPYFSDRISLFDKTVAWTNFVEMLKEYKTEEDFFAEYNKVKDEVIQFIKASDGFNALNSEPSTTFEVKNYSLPDRDTYKEINVGRKFLSIDMVKANFSCLVYYANKMGKSFYDSFNYENFLRQFTKNEYFVGSKYIRQVIFGNCNCKRMIAYEKVMMAQLLDFLLAEKVIVLDDVYSLRADEILIDVTNKTNKEVNIIIDTLLESTRNTTIAFPTNYEVYMIKKFNNEDAYVKVFDDGNFEIKKVDNEDAPAVYRYMKGLEPNELDLYFYHNGRVARFEVQKEWILE